MPRVTVSKRPDPKHKKNMKKLGAMGDSLGRPGGAKKLAQAAAKKRKK